MKRDLIQFSILLVYFGLGITGTVFLIKYIVREQFMRDIIMIGIEGFIVFIFSWVKLINYNAEDPLFNGFLDLTYSPLEHKY